jgi:hypothetical protein
MAGLPPHIHSARAFAELSSQLTPRVGGAQKLLPTRSIYALAHAYLSGFRARRLTPR